jgi:hypothetical protein
MTRVYHGVYGVNGLARKDRRACQGAEGAVWQVN